MSQTTAQYREFVSNGEACYLVPKSQIAAYRRCVEACTTALDNLTPLYASEHIVIKQLRAALTAAQETP